MKFLIVQTAFIGDVILATPIIEKLHHFFPDAQIDFLLRRGNENLLADHPYIRKCWIWDKKKEKYLEAVEWVKNNNLSTSRAVLVLEI